MWVVLIVVLSRLLNKDRLLDSSDGEKTNIETKKELGEDAL